MTIITCYIYTKSEITNTEAFHIIYITMPSHIKKIKRQMLLFTPDEQIARITHEIDRLEKINIRTGSIDRFNKKYTLLNQLKTMGNILITENNKYQSI